MNISTNQVNRVNKIQAFNHAYGFQPKLDYSKLFWFLERLFLGLHCFDCKHYSTKYFFCLELPEKTMTTLARNCRKFKWRIVQKERKFRPKLSQFEDLGDQIICKIVNVNECSCKPHTCINYKDCNAWMIKQKEKIEKFIECYEPGCDNKVHSQLLIIYSYLISKKHKIEYRIRCCKCFNKERIKESDRKLAVNRIENFINLLNEFMVDMVLDSL